MSSKSCVFWDNEEIKGSLEDLEKNDKSHNQDCLLVEPDLFCEEQHMLIDRSEKCM